MHIPIAIKTSQYRSRPFTTLVRSHPRSRNGTGKRVSVRDVSARVQQSGWQRRSRLGVVSKVWLHVAVSRFSSDSSEWL
jgi:hypothetical protein